MSGSSSPAIRMTLVLALAVTGCSAKKDDAKGKQGVESKTGSAPGKNLQLDEKEKEQRATEATNAIRKIYEGAYGYYLQAERTAADPTHPSTAPVFPAPSAGPTPPLGSCCKYPRGLCPANPKDWNKEPWLTIGFAVTSPSSYSYEYKVDNQPAPAAPGAKGKTFTVRAYGDLDCDGEYTTFQLLGVTAPKKPDEAAEGKTAAPHKSSIKITPVPRPKPPQ